jgi:hypothetical protein
MEIKSGESLREVWIVSAGEKGRIGYAPCPNRKRGKSGCGFSWVERGSQDLSTVTGEAS